MMAEENEIPESKGKSINMIIVAFIILIILVIIWAFTTKRLP